jgi:hypothetical protein
VRQVAKIKRSKLYFLPSGGLVRVVKVKPEHNKVFVYNYDSSSNETVDYDIAPKIMTPAFRIGEVARMLGKKQGTLRKYEHLDLIPKARKCKIGESEMRVYTAQDIDVLVEFFETRRGVGRPGGFNKRGTVNRNDVATYISGRYERD